MDKASIHRGELYPLMAHLSALLDAPNILATVQEETKRYTFLALGDESRLRFDHLTLLWHPSTRPVITWKEIDYRYLRLELRRETLSQLLNTLETEAAFFSPRGEYLDCIPRIYHTLEDIFEQLEGMGYEALGAVPEGSFKLQSLPPIQRLEHEGKVLRSMVQECLDDDLAELYSKQQEFLVLLLDNWVRELLPVEEEAFLGTYDLYIGNDFMAVTPH